ncbi:hypothetical protein B7463_g11006, partial [Scytalidium lignicola]
MPTLRRADRARGVLPRALGPRNHQVAGSSATNMEGSTAFLLPQLTGGLALELVIEGEDGTVGV